MMQIRLSFDNYRHELTFYTRSSYNRAILHSVIIFFSSKKEREKYLLSFYFVALAFEIVEDAV